MFNLPWLKSAFVSLATATIWSEDNSSTATENCVPAPSRHKMMSTIPIINNRNPNYGLSTFNQLFRKRNNCSNKLQNKKLYKHWIYNPKFIGSHFSYYSLLKQRHSQSKKQTRSLRSCNNFFTHLCLNKYFSYYISLRVCIYFL